VKDEFRDLCVEAILVWDQTGDIEPVIDKMRLAIALSPTKKTRGRNQQVKSYLLPQLPEFAEPYRPHLQEWWDMRCRKHKSADRTQLSSKTLDALALAEKLGVLKEFCEYAAEKDWMSLGFAGHTEYLQKLAKDKKFAASGGQQQTVQSRYTPPPPVNMETHPSYRPLINDDEQFF
jgi:hypothetical protein